MEDLIPNLNKLNLREILDKNKKDYYKSLAKSKKFKAIYSSFTDPELQSQITNSISKIK